MFLEKASEDEFFASLEKNLNKNHSFNDDLEDRRDSDVQAYLKHAASALARAGLRKEAEAVIMISKDLSDPATRGLTSTKMENNLKQHGHVLNHNADSCMAVDCMQCSENGDQPQLSQDELKRLRSILNKA